jgi:hypothetical protein
MEMKVKNPIKQTAVSFAHMMDYNENQFKMGDWEREAFRKEYNTFINEEIINKGYDVTMIINLAVVYKTLSMKDYYEWIYI